MGKNVIVLGGTTDHIYLIEYLKELGFYTILIDYLDNPPAKQYCDLFLQISILDKEKVLEIAKEYDVKYVLCTSVDQALSTAAYVCEQLNLPFHINYQTSKILSNKVLMKELMIKNEIPSSKSIKLQNLDEIGKLNLEFPLVIKPVDANSSKGVYRVNNLDELRDKHQKSLEFSPSKSLILEEFMEGLELSIDAFVVNKDVHICMISENIKSKINVSNFTIIESFYDKFIEEKIHDLVLEIVSKLAHSINLTNGPLLVQAIYNQENETIKVIEFSSRLGGGSKYFFIRENKNFDALKSFVNLIIGENVKIDNIQSQHNYSKFKFLYAKPLIINGYSGLKQLKENGVINEYFIYKEIGSKVDESSKSTDRCCGIYVSDNDMNTLVSKINQAINTIEIVDKDNRNYLKTL